MPRDIVVESPLAARYHAAIEIAVRRARPRETRDGAKLVADAMAIVANDACQRLAVVPCSLSASDDERDVASGYADDPRSVRTLRILLAALGRVTRSARPSTAPGMSPGREQNGTETPNARATSRAVQSD